MNAIDALRRANPVKRLGEGSWIAEGFTTHAAIYAPSKWFVWVPAGDGHVLRYVDKTYTARVR